MEKVHELVQLSAYWSFFCDDLLQGIVCFTNGGRVSFTLVWCFDSKLNYAVQKAVISKTIEPPTTTPSAEFICYVISLK